MPLQKREYNKIARTRALIYQSLSFLIVACEEKDVMTPRELADAKKLRDSLLPIPFAEAAETFDAVAAALVHGISSAPSPSFALGCAEEAMLPSLTTAPVVFRKRKPKKGSP